MAAFTLEAQVPHTWHIDTAVSRHMSGNIDLFQSIQCTDPVTISIADRSSFTANQEGTICVRIVSDPRYDHSNIPIKLVNVLYVPNLDSNLLSVSRMTNVNIDVTFG
jgi:Pol polyprotein, beta-barrel domain